MVGMGADPYYRRKLLSRSSFRISCPYLRSAWVNVFVNDKTGFFILFVNAAIKVEA